MNPKPVEPWHFAFERDFVDTLRCVPMIVRYKLDISRLKLTLPEWGKLSLDEKANLANWPCYSKTEIVSYRACVSQLVTERCAHQINELADVEASWENLDQVPDEVQQKALEYHGARLPLGQWQQLAILQRFALIKLSRSHHEGRNFPRALAEFKLTDPEVRD